MSFEDIAHLKGLLKKKGGGGGGEEERREKKTTWGERERERKCSENGKWGN